jgi:PIN domain nuclease of toxin-antitoxin system
MGARKGRNGTSGLVYLDTHAAVWLAEGEADWLSSKAREAIRRGDLRLSPMAVLELDMLHEIQRVTRPASETVIALRVATGVEICEAPWTQVVEVARRLHWTRDPFDRLIVAHAASQGARLVTMDETILRNYERALC